MGAENGVNDSWALGVEGTIHGFPSSVYDYQKDIIRDHTHSPNSVDDYQKSIEDLKHKLLYTTVELESVRTHTNTELIRKEEQIRRSEDEIRRKEERVDELIRQLKITTQDRDEARYQLQMLLNKIAQQPVDLHPPIAFQPDSPLFRPTRGSSSITESDSLSETHAFFDTVTSPDFSNMNMADSCNVAATPYQPPFPQFKSSTAMEGIANYDTGSAIIDRLAARRGLPERGKLLEAVQAVTRATPLLETLLMTGPLPQWRNPPPMQLFRIPPVTVEGHGSGLINQAAAMNPNLEEVQLDHHLSTRSIDLSMTRRGFLSPLPISSRSSIEKRQSSQ